MHTLFFVLMWDVCSIPQGSCSPHWRFSLDVGTAWDPGQRATSAYMTVEDGKKLQEDILKMHENTLLLKSQGANNTLWDQITRYTGISNAGFMLIMGIWKKISDMKKFIPSAIRGQELTVLPTAPVQMRHH